MRRFKYIVGSFGKKRTYFLHTINKSNKLTIFFHGVFSTTLDVKHQEIIKKIEKNNYNSDFLCFETSRHYNTFENKNYSFEEYANTFNGKNFTDELDDIKNLLRSVNIEQYTEIIFVGFSLGGTLSSFFIEEYSEKVKKIFLFGSGISTKRKTLPILSTYPTKKDILHNFKKYEGDLIIVQGSLDTIVPQKDANLIISTASMARKTALIRLLGVDHRFLTKFNKPYRDILNEELSKIIVTS